VKYFSSLQTWRDKPDPLFSQIWSLAEKEENSMHEPNKIAVNSRRLSLGTRGKKARPSLKNKARTQVRMVSNPGEEPA
jgi:hypothetical protein